MSMTSQRATLVWKEWIPLVSQQQRLRNLIQIIAYNINPYEKCYPAENKAKNSFYYTLHLTTLSAPFYTSEKIESDNPKWDDIEINQDNGAADGVVIRLWCHPNEGVERVVTVWGLYLSGLTYLGPRLGTAHPSLFKSNTLILHMQGGYFTASHCFKEPRPQAPRLSSVDRNPIDVRPSYSVSLLLRLHSIQQAIKQHSVAAASLRERISEGGVGLGVGGRGESAMLRRVLHRTSPPAYARHHQLTTARREVEEVRFRVNLLTHERDKKQAQLRLRVQEKNKLAEENLDKEVQLMENYRSLHRDLERLKELKRAYAEVRENLFMIGNKLQVLKRKRIQELNIIYPITQIGDEKFAICGVHLPNSENFAGHDEIMISVALGFVAHLVQMISYFLHIPLRYAIIHAGSRSKIVDHITEKLPENEREFPLFSRGKDKLHFNYGVYLLNKNIAQLRWNCKLTTNDLRPTLPNLLALLNLYPSYTALGLEGRTLSSSTLELHERDRGVLSPLSGRQRLRSSHSPLSYSLDKGLDQLEFPPLKLRPAPRQRSITHNSTLEPVQQVDAPQSSEDDGQREFLHSWVSQGPISVSSDIEVESEKSLRQSPVPEESLASIINKINSPSSRTEPKYSRIKREGEPFNRESIRQVTSKSELIDLLYHK